MVELLWYAVAYNVANSFPNSIYQISFLLTWHISYVPLMWVPAYL